MACKTTFKPFLSLLITFFCAVTFGYGQIITFDFDSYVGDELFVDSNSNDPFLSSSTITRGTGLNAFNNLNRFNSRSWAGTSIANAVTGNDYVQFTVSPISGYQFDITTIVFNIQRSGSGLSAIALRSSIDGYATNIDGEKAILDNTDITEIVTFTVNQSTVATPVTYRIYGWAEAGTGSGGFEGTGNDIIVNGTVSAIPACGGTPTTWSAGAWDNGVPDLSTPAIIAANYNTATNGGSFSASSLLVEDGATLTINDEDGGSTNDYVVVQNDVTINGIIAIEPKAAFVQLDDSGAVGGTGFARVIKETAPMNAWYEYTYWSSPVTGAQIETALPESEPSRRFVFNAQNFLDATAETGNNNAITPGQDDIDDDNNDWENITGDSVMIPGVGYATTLTEFTYSISPGTSNKQFRAATFEGLPNNGIITVPVYRNDDETNDNNWNLIGNPYPSAIDADLFLAANANIDANITTLYTIDGAIFLWSQNTAPSDTANGNQALNFSDADYAIINGTGQTAGGDGITPERKIPSGQAFFVSMSDAAPDAVPFTGNIFTADVLFNNSMRVRGAADNSQFFKDTNSKNNSSVANKLWIDLTSDNGVFNQTLIGYVNGATNNDDGMYFDAQKNVSTKASAILYTNIEGSNKKFAIQGKATNSLSETETIKLGFATNIDVPTLYTLSIAQLQGDFLTANAVYLKDNLTGTVHNLKECDYTFTSEVGEFNDRFVVMFNNQSLSTEELLVDANTLKIVDLDDNHIQFTVPTDLKINTVSIFNLLGKEIYKFNGQNSSETYAVSGLNQTIYIAKVILSNGTVMTKKALKK